MLSALALAKRIEAGELTPVGAIELCEQAIAQHEKEVGAFVALDVPRAKAKARAAAAALAATPLRGLPIGFKDIFDTADFPTCYGSKIYAGHQPRSDAALVAMTRRAGGILIGKTVSTEMAFLDPAATRNPRNLAHTPGGSSSGSGAAVGDYMVPLAFGTQTGGSLIRPAAFNGIYALKPTWGAVTREGAKLFSAMCDTVGWYGRSVADLALVAHAFRLRDLASQTPTNIRGLKVAMCKTPYWDKAEPSAQQALATAIERLQNAGARTEELELPSRFGALNAAQRTIARGEGGAAFLPELLTHGERLHVEFRDMAENKHGITGRMMVEAYDLVADCCRTFESLSASFDAVVTPSAPGEAPEGLHTTGEFIFNGMWTLMHMPCLAIPCVKGPKALPVGIQLVGPRYSDARLLAVAAALAPVIDAEPAKRPSE